MATDEKKSPCLSTNFGATVTGYLQQRHMTQASLATVVGRSGSHINHVLTGRHTRATATWADIIANALELTDEERYRIHLAAARDQGFKL